MVTIPPHNTGTEIYEDIQSRLFPFILSYPPLLSSLLPLSSQPPSTPPIDPSIHPLLLFSPPTVLTIEGPSQRGRGSTKYTPNLHTAGGTRYCTSRPY
jgi:hypothetical protein